MENLIEKINAKAKEIQIEKIAKVCAEKEDFDKKLETIKGLGERISKMWNVAQALLDNGFRIGEDVYNYGLEPYHTLETDGWNHWIGFCVRNKDVQWFGIAGGGCCGHDFKIDKNGNTLIDKNIIYGRRYKYFEDGNNKRHLNRILEEFEEYERKFYEYVEKLVS